MIFNVSIMTTANDNGYCLSFWTKADADRAASAARADGCHTVYQWSS